MYVKRLYGTRTFAIGRKSVVLFARDDLGNIVNSVRLHVHGTSPDYRT